jgi:hypothetical protein
MTQESKIRTEKEILQLIFPKYKRWLQILLTFIFLDKYTLPKLNHEGIEN